MITSYSPVPPKNLLNSDNKKNILPGKGITTRPDYLVDRNGEIIILFSIALAVKIHLILQAVSGG